MSINDCSRIYPSYVAGLLDGEGYLGLRRSNPNQHKPITIVSVNMCHRETIERLAEFYAPNAQYRHEAPKNKNHKDIYRIDWRGQKAITLLKIVRPYLITKAIQADVLLEVGGFVPVRRGRPRKGGGWTQAQRERMDELMRLSKELNRRGR